MRSHIAGKWIEKLSPKIMLHEDYVVERVQDMINSIIYLSGK